MPSVTYSENLSKIIDNYDVVTGTTHDNFTWDIQLNNNYGIRESSAILSYPNVANEKIQLTNGKLDIYPASNRLSVNSESIYTNPSSISMSLNRDVSTMSVFEVDISSLRRSNVDYYRSFDLFEAFSEDILGEYSPQEDFIGYSNGSVEIGVVLLRAPSPNKIKNARTYLGEIIDRGAVGELGMTSLDKVCEESYIGDDERILTLVYCRDGKYYDEHGNLIRHYGELSNGYSFKYFGSNQIGGLVLDMVGHDGRFIEDSNFNASLIDYSKDFSATRVYNKTFIPKKEHNTVINTYSVNDNNKLKILSSHIEYDGLQVISFTVNVNGKTYSTNPISIPNNGSQLRPVIRNRDFSLTPSLTISDIKITEGSVVNTLYPAYGAFLTKYMAPVIMPSTIGNEVILDGSPLNISILNYNTLSSTIHYSLYASGVLVEELDYSSPISITEPGEYKIVARVFNNTFPERRSLDSEYSVLVYDKATIPSLHTSTLTLDGVTNKNVEFYFTTIENISTIFTTNGEVPMNTPDNYYIAQPNMKFYIDKTTTIKYFALEGKYLKSDTATQTVVVTKTNTTPTPTIDTDNSSTITNRAELQISADSVSDIIYYTLDGSSPTEQSTRYVAGRYITAPSIGDSITVKAIAVRDGYNNSVVASKTFTFNYSCNPWVGSDRVSIGIGSVTLNGESRITRSIGIVPNYSMEFSIMNCTKNSVLEISNTKSINEYNNYSGKYSDDLNFTITCIHAGDECSIFGIGDRSERYDTTGYSKYGEITVPSGQPLDIVYELVNVNSLSSVSIDGDSVALDATYSAKISVTNGFDTIESGVIHISNVGLPTISSNPLFGGDVAEITIGNIYFTCI